MTQAEIVARDAARGAEQQARVQEYMSLYAAPSCSMWRLPDVYVAEARILARLETGEERDSLSMDLLARWQAWRCAICGHRDALVVDHDHRTALVRGLLCRTCNFHEGGGECRSRDAFAQYRASPPTSLLGISVVYFSPFTGEAIPQIEPAR